MGIYIYITYYMFYSYNSFCIFWITSTMCLWVQKYRGYIGYQPIMVKYRKIGCKQQQNNHCRN